MEEHHEWHSDCSFSFDRDDSSGIAVRVGSHVPRGSVVVVDMESVHPHGPPPPPPLGDDDPCFKK